MPAAALWTDIMKSVGDGGSPAEIASRIFTPLPVSPWRLEKIQAFASPAPSSARAASQASLAPGLMRRAFIIGSRFVKASGASGSPSGMPGSAACAHARRSAPEESPCASTTWEAMSKSVIIRPSSCGRRGACAPCRGRRGRVRSRSPRPRRTPRTRRRDRSGSCRWRAP